MYKILRQHNEYIKAMHGGISKLIRTFTKTISNLIKINLEKIIIKLEMVLVKIEDCTI